VKHLFSNWKRIERLLKGSDSILLLADYDGTLTPIVSRPEDAILDNSLRKILRSLAKKKRFYIGVISGRKLDNVKGFIRINGIYYAGSHGLEIKGPDISFIHPSCKRFRTYLIEIKNGLYSRVKSIKGAIVEYKKGSISLHYRLVKKNQVKKLKTIFKEVCLPYVKRGRIKISSGKKIWEIKLPVKWNKGSAVGKILNRVKRGQKKVLPIYLGDDVTDEDAFSFLNKRRAITIFVGKRRKSGARYYLRSPYEVKKFLIRLCQV